MSEIKLPDSTVQVITMLRAMGPEMAIGPKGRAYIYEAIIELADAYADAMKHAQDYQRRAVLAESVLLNLHQDLLEHQDATIALTRAVGDAVAPFEPPGGLQHP